MKAVLRVVPITPTSTLVLVLWVDSRFSDSRISRYISDPCHVVGTIRLAEMSFLDNQIITMVSAMESKGVYYPTTSLIYLPALQIIEILQNWSREVNWDLVNEPEWLNPYDNHFNPDFYDNHDTYENLEMDVLFEEIQTRNFGARFVHVNNTVFTQMSHVSLPLMRQMADSYASGNPSAVSSVLRYYPGHEFILRTSFLQVPPPSSFSGRICYRSSITRKDFLQSIEGIRRKLSGVDTLFVGREIHVYENPIVLSKDLFELVTV